METGWIGTGSDEAMEAREILGRSLLPELSSERRELEERRAAETAAGDKADEAAFKAWAGGGHTTGEVLARAEDPADRAHRSRIAQARELLRDAGLGDLLPGGCGGGVMDPNTGFTPVAGPRMTRADAMERATAGRDRRARQAREAAGLEAIELARAVRPEGWAERMSRFVAGR
jgi:hypothetical protein